MTVRARAFISMILTQVRCRRSPADVRALTGEMATVGYGLLRSVTTTKRDKASSCSAGTRAVDRLPPKCKKPTLVGFLILVLAHPG